MEPINWIFLGLLLLFLFRKRPAPATKQITEEYVYVAKDCPPHQWNWVEVKDQTGAVVTEKLVCKLCGPLKPLESK